MCDCWACSGVLCPQQPDCMLSYNHYSRQMFKYLNAKQKFLPYSDVNHYPVWSACSGSSHFMGCLPVRALQP